MLLPEQKRDQITHLLLRDRCLEAIRHERAVEGLHVFDRGTGERLFRAAGHGEDDRVGSFDLVATPAGFEHAVGGQVLNA
jgi:hypothetical protein